VSQTYEWAVLRVVPRVERGEQVNVGVVVYCRALDYLGVWVSDDLSRAVAIAPDLDVDAVRLHLDAVVAVCAGAPEAGGSGRRTPGDRFRWLVAPRSTVVQTSPVHTTASPTTPWPSARPGARDGGLAPGADARDGALPCSHERARGTPSTRWRRPSSS
jgi:hypothetical protein